MVFTIGIDPHKATHTAAVLDGSETVSPNSASLLTVINAIVCCRSRNGFTPRTWAIEQATGLGALLAQQLVAVGETVLDVPPTLSARVRLLDSTRTDKTDSHDARAAAIVALRHQRLRPVTLVDHSAVLRLLADRHHDLTALRTQAVCRLHALLCQLTAGGAAGRLSAPRAAQILRHIRAFEPVGTERKRVALELLGDLRRFDNQLVSVNERIVEAVLTSGTTATNVHGVGALGAAIIVGHTADITRFPDAGHYARYNGTAPIEASSALKNRHRLNPRGNRQLNCALHVAAVTQVAHDTDGRVYYQRKLAEGKSRKEALRALKRQISNAVYRRLVADTRR